MPGLEALSVLVGPVGSSRPALQVVCAYRPPRTPDWPATLADLLAASRAGVECPLLFGADTNLCLAQLEAEELRLTLEAFDLKVLNDPALPTHGERVLDCLPVLLGPRGLRPAAPKYCRASKRAY
jgi:hypothetical protein